VKVTVGIIGLGTVGGAMLRGLQSLSRPVRGYDIEPALGTHSLDATLVSDVIFITLPTPVDAANHCDLSAIEAVFARAESLEISGLLVLRSTVPVGTTDRLIAAHPTLRIGFSPEFLRASSADGDFLQPAFTLYGGPSADVFLAALEGICGRPASCLFLPPREAEMAKLFLNSFATVKAVFASQLAEFATGQGIDWGRVVNAISLDPRTGVGYLDAAGPDGLPGVGGHCLPKDSRMLLGQLGAGSLLEAALKINVNLRDLR